MTAFTESAVLVGDNQLFGIVARPSSQPRNTGVILLNSGLLHRVGPSRLYVLLSRRLAASGFVTARIDVSGKGDSPRRQGSTAERALLQDYDDIGRSLQVQHELDRFILIGLCSGADDAYAIASARDNVAGLVLLDGYAAKTLRYYLRHYRSRALHLERWLTMSRRMVDAVLHVAGRRSGSGERELSMAEVRHFPDIPEARRRFERISRYCDRCLCIYTSASHSYYNYEGQLGGTFPTFRPKYGLRELYLPAARHTYPLAHHRQLVIDTICTWAEDFE